MRNSDIERWTLEIIRRVENHQPVEDSRVELKRHWPIEYSRAARQLAGHANAACGEHILWLIGIDEHQGTIGADYQEVSNWLNQLISNFNQLAPEVALHEPSTAGYGRLSLCRPTAIHCARRQRRTLSATAKKPASMAGFLYLFLSITAADRFLFSRPHYTLTALLSVAYSNSK